MKRLVASWRPLWQPKPLVPPVVDHDLPRLSAIERSAEVMRFMGHRLVYWLSPQGQLREFIKLNLRVALTVAIPALVVAPLITLALGQFQTWVVVLTQTMSSFVLFPLSVLLSILLVCGLLYIIRTCLDLRGRGRRDMY